MSTMVEVCGAFRSEDLALSHSNLIIAGMRVEKFQRPMPAFVDCIQSSAQRSGSQSKFPRYLRSLSSIATPGIADLASSSRTALEAA
jgi:hypothetical protein